MDWSFFADQLLSPSDKFIKAFFLVIYMSLISMFFGIILGTVLDELERRDLSTGLITLCVGAGMGTATIIERI